MKPLTLTLPHNGGTKSKWLVALCIAAAAFPSASLPARAATPGSLVAPTGPALCIDLPLSSAELSPTSCWVTGPTSSIVAGTDARHAADGAVYLIHDQKKRRADLPGAGRLTITSVSADQACVRDAAGGDHAVGVNTGITAIGCAPIGTTLPPGGVKGVTEPDATAPTPPPATTSYYVYGAYLAQCGPGATTGCPLYNFGVGTYASSSTPSGLVILDFGAPCYNPNTLVYGTQLFNTFVCTPDDQLVPMAQAWINGFESANPTRTTPTILGLGSSNSVTGADPPTYHLTPGQMYSAGSGWFTKVVKPVATGPTGLAPLTVWAASDIEQSSGGDWYDALTTRPWLDAYQAAAGPVAGAKCGATTPYQMVNYGDYVVPNKPGWTPADVYFVSWGAPLACALPEIYYTVNANEWAQLNTWAAGQHLSSIQFTGVMSEDGQGGTLSAADSWMALYNATGQQAPYLTVIGTAATPATPFEAPTSVRAVPGGASASVSWTAPRLDGGHHITSYTIMPYIGSVAQSTTTVVSGNPPPVTGIVSGLSNGTAYTFAVTAFTSVGPGPESVKSNAVTPSDAFPYTVVTTQQYELTANDGATWTDVDPTNLVLTLKPGTDATAIMSANADLWTANAGINQDLGIAVTGGIYPTTIGQPQVWKESGGFGGTYSPNAAFAQTAIPLKAGTSYDVRLRWKANKAEGTAVIFAGAGNGAYSPTRLSVQLVPSGNSKGVASAAQYAYPGGTGWAAIDPSALAFDYTAPTAGTAVVSGNADLWTSVGGYNQDLGIFVDNTLVAWKESGGFAGTYSPNAAFVLATVPLNAGPHAVALAFRGNKTTPRNVVFAGAGPGPSHSPTTLSLRFLPAGQVIDASSTSQYGLQSSDGSSWSAIDGTALTISVNRSDNCLVILTGNADLWTSVAGINQDLGITITPADAVTYPSNLIGWKESGGFAGTFSPNAAAIETVFAMPGGSSYTATLVWKTNKSSARAAHAGAGQSPHSPTRLTAVLSCQ